ncbi:unnamed protein product [Phytophthora lilii]|uniref:Unnamed protein product n=1 Tax=Phytophthora lilii TaxID=2077276 RepID=A0A9W6TS45_9STRA|nr:unnamed protein product [Phytophthora lilii]
MRAQRELQPAARPAGPPLSPSMSAPSPSSPAIVDPCHWQAQAETQALTHTPRRREASVRHRQLGGAPEADVGAAAEAFPEHSIAVVRELWSQRCRPLPKLGRRPSFDLGLLASILRAELGGEPSAVEKLKAMKSPAVVRVLNAGLHQHKAVLQQDILRMEQEVDELKRRLL